MHRYLERLLEGEVAASLHAQPRGAVQTRPATPTPLAPAAAVNAEAYTHTAIFYFYITWNDSTAADTVRESTAAMKNGSSECPTLGDAQGLTPHPPRRTHTRAARPPTTQPPAPSPAPTGRSTLPVAMASTSLPSSFAIPLASPRTAKPGTASTRRPMAASWPRPLSMACITRCSLCRSRCARRLAPPACLPACLQRPRCHRHPSDAPSARGLEQVPL